MSETNPLIDDRTVDFLLRDVLALDALCEWPDFASHSVEGFALVLGSARKLAREVLYPAYGPMDREPPRFEHGAVRLHPLMKRLYPAMVDLGLLEAARPEAHGGPGLPATVTFAASAYLMAANLSAYGYLGLTAGAAHLLDAFGDDALKRAFVEPLYAGRWTGTMALTEPHAGSSLADVRTRARPAGDGSYRIDGAKVFISGGEQDLSENIVHMTLARIEGAPAGIKGVSLFAIPRLRPARGLGAGIRSNNASDNASDNATELVPNDVRCTGAFHKMGWRGLPSVALAFGDEHDCHGWLVGEPHRGIAYMFQMMNEARLGVGFHAIATASVAFHEALAYARSRPQGRRLEARDPSAPQVPIIEHADVRRMLLRQKAIVEGGLALLLTAARFADAAGHAPDPGERSRAALLLDLLTPVAKSFPAERGFEANALCVQVHGGYGYTSEYLPEAWLRDQKLNSIHEGTTGIQSLDLLGRKVVAGQGAALAALGDEVSRAIADARTSGVEPAWCDALAEALAQVQGATLELAQRGVRGEPEAMLRHSVDYLDMMGVLLVGWQWLAMSAAARRDPRRTLAADFVQGKLRAAQYWFATEVPRVALLAARCRSGEDSFAAMAPEWF